jgi:hypothetical protein
VLFWSNSVSAPIPIDMTKLNPVTQNAHLSRKTANLFGEFGEFDPLIFSKKWKISSNLHDYKLKGYEKVQKVYLRIKNNARQSLEKKSKKVADLQAEVNKLHKDTSL